MENSSSRSRSVGRWNALASNQGGAPETVFRVSNVPPPVRFERERQSGAGECARSGDACSSTLSTEPPPPTSRTNEQRGSRMRKARRGWTMPEEDARSMLTMIEERIRSSDIRVEHRDALIRLRAMIEDDLEGSARGEAASWPSSCAM